MSRYSFLCLNLFSVGYACVWILSNFIFMSKSLRLWLNYVTSPNNQVTSANDYIHKLLVMLLYKYSGLCLNLSPVRYACIRIVRLMSEFFLVAFCLNSSVVSDFIWLCLNLYADYAFLVLCLNSYAYVWILWLLPMT